MKKLASAIFILFFLYGTASPQSCLPLGITFTTQEQIDNFQTNNPGCTEIEGNVFIQGDNITNLNGLDVLTAIWGDLMIGRLSMGGNNALTSLTGLENLISIGGSLEIEDNDALTSLTGLDNVTSIGGGFDISSNDSLTSLLGLDNVTSIGGNIEIGFNNSLTSLTGLDNLTSIGDLFIHNNYALASLTGLDNLTSIGEDLVIFENNALTSLTGLENLISIGGSLEIDFNDALLSLTGLDNVTSIIGGGLSISENPALTSLLGLDNVASIGGSLIIYDNAALTSLTGLDNINAGSIDDLYIFNNSSLPTCEVQSICDYLASPNGIIEIYNNATGCNSQVEVEEACELSVESINPKDEISIFPNPANRQLTISNKDGTTIDEIIIYYQTGQIVLLEKPVNNIIDISELQPGMYILEAVTEKRKIREKLVIE